MKLGHFLHYLSAYWLIDITEFMPYPCLPYAQQYVWRDAYGLNAQISFSIGKSPKFETPLEKAANGSIMSNYFDLNGSRLLKDLSFMGPIRPLEPLWTCQTS